MPTYTGATEKEVIDQMRQQQCGRKTQYWSEADALRQADRLHANLRAYRCNFCRNWHLTHQRKAK